MLLPSSSSLLQLVEAVARHRIDRDVAEALQEGLELPLVDLARLHMLGNRLAGEFAVVVVGQLGARRADDARRLGELAGALALVERRQQLALGKVAGAAEDDEVERFDGDDLAGHATFRSRGGGQFERLII